MTVYKLVLLQLIKHLICNEDNKPLYVTVFSFYLHLKPDSVAYLCLRGLSDNTIQNQTVFQNGYLAKKETKNGERKRRKIECEEKIHFKNKNSFRIFNNFITFITKTNKTQETNAVT